MHICNYIAFNIFPLYSLNFDLYSCGILVIFLFNFVYELWILSTCHINIKHFPLYLKTTI